MTATYSSLAQNIKPTPYTGKKISRPKSKKKG